MKKILTIIVLTSAFVCAQAQEKVPDMPFQHSEYFLESLQNARSMGQDVYVDETAAPAARQAAPAAKAADATAIGYLNPAGTLFLGMDEKGKGTFISNPGVIGGWSDSIPCWKWINKQTGYKSIKYLTAFSKAYPAYCDGENYGVDAYGNFCDTLIASGGYTYYKDGNGDDGYYWQQATPHQTVRMADGSEKTYMMLSTAANPSAENCPLAAGGLPSGNTSDGLWPLTNAVSTTRAGVSMELVDYIAGDGYVSYLFGSSEYTVDSVAVPNAEMTGDSMTYTRVKPVALVVHYDKPQTPLYVKNISIAIGSYVPEDLYLYSLNIEVLTEEGELIATSEAYMWDTKDMSYKPGKLLTFNFEKYTEYGELLNEGFLVDKAFKIKITGFDPQDEFGIYSAKCYVHPTKAEMLYEGGVIAGIDYEPYIMLNGIYPTLEDYYRSLEAETGQVGDTIPVNMISYNSDGYKYTAAYAKWGTNNTEFAFYSTFMPYDSVSRVWTMDIYKPKYIRLAADFDSNLNSDPDDDPITLWSYYRLFTLHIYATETPQLGECIKIGKYGKYIVFRVDAINGVNDIRNINWEDSKAEKFVHDGQLYIRKNNKLYNVVGQQIQNQ